MNQTIRFDFSNAFDFVKQHEWNLLAPAVEMAHEMLHQRTGPGHDFLGWVDLPAHYDRTEFQRITQAAARIQSDSDAGGCGRPGYEKQKAELEARLHGKQNVFDRS